MAIPTRKGTTYSEPKKPEKKDEKTSVSTKKVNLSVTSAVGNIRKSASKARDI